MDVARIIFSGRTFPLAAVSESEGVLFGTKPQQVAASETKSESVSLKFKILRKRIQVEIAKFFKNQRSKKTLLKSEAT